MKENLTTKVEVMAKDIAYLKEEIAEIKQLIKDHTVEERATWDLLMNKKADKWVEKAIVWAVVGVVGAAAALVWSRVI